MMLMGIVFRKKEECGSGMRNQVNATRNSVAFCNRDGGKGRQETVKTTADGIKVLDM